MFWGLLNSTPELCERLRLGLRVKPCVSGAHSVTLNPSLAAPVERAHAVTLNPSLAAPVELLILSFIPSLYHSSGCLSTPVFNFRLHSRCSFNRFLGYPILISFCFSLSFLNYTIVRFACQPRFQLAQVPSSLSQKLSRGSSITSSLSAFTTSL